MANLEDIRRTSPLTAAELAAVHPYVRRILHAFNSLHGEESVSPPAAAAKVDKLPDTKLDKDDVQCSICLMEFEIGENAKLLPCDHQFHRACLIPWFTKTSTCPICRHDARYEKYKKEKEPKEQTQQEQEIEEVRDDDRENYVYSNPSPIFNL